MNFYSYFVLSALVVAGIVAHAYVAHEQFYPAVVYLSSDKMCLAVMYNFAFALFLLFGKVLLRVFIGTLRDLEVEQLVDSGRGFLADTILFLVFYAPTIDNREVGTVHLIQYICCVIFMKVFHLTTQIRVSHMFEVGVPRLIVNLKLVSLMCLLLCCDLLALQYFYSVASRSSTFFTWILFEALTMSTVVLVSIFKYSVHMIDLRLDNGWPGKSVCLFYIDLVHDVVSMTLFLVFMLTFFVQNPSRLPIYMMADVIQVARKLAQRLRSFRRYRRISLNMDMRFPDALDEEIERDEYCVICRDSLFEGSKPKKLPCNHIFHIDCLRSWLVMQQVCPTCRAEITADAPVPSPAVSTIPVAAAPQNAGGAPGVQPPAPSPGAAAAPAPAPPPPAAATTSPPYGGTAASAAAPGVGPAGTPAAAGSAGIVLGAQAADHHRSPPGPASAGPSLTGIAAAAPAQGAHPEGPFTFGHSASAAASGHRIFDGPPVAGVQEIMDSLKRAEEISKFLRQQTEFWMEQVRQIEQSHSGQGAFPGGLHGAGLVMAPPMVPVMQWPLLSATGAPGPPAAASSAPSGAAASAGGGASSSSSGAGAAPSTESPPPAAAGASSSSVPEGGSAAAAAAADVEAAAAAADGGDAAADGPLRDQMAELRRARQERWQTQRTASTLSNQSGAAGGGGP